MGTEAALRLPGIADSDARRVRELTETIGAYQELLPKLNAQDSETRYAALAQGLSEAEDQLAELDRRISEKLPRYAGLRSPKTVSLAEAKAFCGEDLAILEFALWDSSVEFMAPAAPGSVSSYQKRPSINSYCLVITKDALTPVALKPGIALSAMEKSLRAKLLNTNASGGIELLSEDAFETERSALYAALIKPVLERGLIPAGVKRLLIVPDGELAFLPFDILRESPASPELGESYRISLSASVSVSILAAQSGNIGAEPVLAFGGALYDSGGKAAESSRGIKLLSPEETAAAGFEAPPSHYPGRQDWANLPGTEAEVRIIEKIAKRSTVFLGRDTSEAKVKELSASGELERYPILHFACHGYFNGTHPQLSAIVFSEVSGLLPESPEDGYLTVAEAALLRLDARAVILSACDTGRGGLKHGDGMVGLVRSLFAAGSRSAGVSLWPIADDAAVAFMENVYRLVLKGGMSFREAYYRAKQEFRLSGNWKHPFYRAAFVLYE